MIGKLIRQLEREVARLPATDGRKIARRNARKRVLGQLRRIRAAVDQQWPAIVEPARRNTLTTHRGKLKRAERRGLVRVTEGRAGEFALLGVRVTQYAGCMWVPQWAVKIQDYRPEKLAAAVKMPKLRNAILAERCLAI